MWIEQVEVSTSCDKPGAVHHLKVPRIEILVDSVLAYIFASGVQNKYCPIPS